MSRANFLRSWRKSALSTIFLLGLSALQPGCDDGTESDMVGDGANDVQTTDYGAMMLDGSSGDAGCAEPEMLESCDLDSIIECEPRAGTNSATLLVGTVLDPTRVYCSGEVLVDGDTGLIACVGDTCREHPMAQEASVVCADLIAPGFIDPHNHMTFNTLPPWQHGERLFSNRGEWRPLISRELYGARPSGSDPVAARYSELRLLMAGTTAVHKAANVTASHDHVRNLDRGPNAHGLGYGDQAVEECVFPLTEGCRDAPDYAAMRQIPERSYVAHVAEGVDERSRAEFDDFVESGQLGPETAIIHCVSCGGPELSAIRAAGAKLIWSPQSNIDLYGATLDVPAAINMGIPLALGPDWTPSGTMNQLAEMKCARSVSQTYFGGVISDKDIVSMITDKAAIAMGVEDLIGRLDVGLYGDIVLISGDRTTPHTSVVDADAQSIRGVFIGGRAYYGDSDIFSPENRRNDLCEVIDVCAGEKTICVRDEAGESNPTDPDDWPKFGFDEVRLYVERVVERKRPDDLPDWLNYVYEAHPIFECEPTFSCRFGNNSVSGRPSDTDQDGDDIADSEDNCPDIFNPNQDDLDGDGDGNSCDPCPWSEDPCSCAVPTGFDLDADGLVDEDDNCPTTSNPDQADQDGDGVGDVCDLCPELADGPAAGCPTTIPNIKRGEVPADQFVSVEGVVTAVLPDFAPATQEGSFFMQVSPDQSESQAPRHEGLFVYLGNRAQGVRTPNVGDQVRLTGKTNDFYGQTQLTQVQVLEVMGEMIPIPEVELSVLELSERGEPYESMLVCIPQVQVTNLDPPRGPGDAPDGERLEFEVTDLETGSSIRVNDGLHLVSPFPELGDEFKRICGVHRLSNGAYKIEPRSAEDLDRGPPRVVQFGPEGTFIRVGESAVPATGAGDALRVFLSAPAGVDGVEVSLSSGKPNALAVPNSVFVQPGAVEATVSVDALAREELVILQASAPDQEGAVMTTVRVISADIAPLTMRFQPSDYVSLVGGELALTLAFDAPTLNEQIVNITGPAALGLEPLIRLPVPRNRLTVQFSIATLELGIFEVTARTPRLLARANVEVIDNPPQPLISEINPDMSGPEDQEFVEIYNPSPLPVDLSGWAVELMNGSNGMAYKRIEFGEMPLMLSAFGRLVVGDDIMAEQLPQGVIFFPLGSRGTQHDIQNGNPDGAQLLQDDVVVDSMSYGGVIDGVTEGEVGAPDDLNDENNESLSRCPDGQDTQDNALDFILRPATPGLPNACVIPIQGDAGLPDADMDLGVTDAEIPEMPPVDAGIVDAAIVDFGEAPPDAAIDLDAAGPDALIELDSEVGVDSEVDQSLRLDLSHDQGQPMDAAPADADLDGGGEPDLAAGDASESDPVLDDAAANDAAPDGAAVEDAAVEDDAVVDGSVADDAALNDSTPLDASSDDAEADDATPDGAAADGDAADAAANDDAPMDDGSLGDAQLGDSGEVDDADVDQSADDAVGD